MLPVAAGGARKGRRVFCGNIGFTSCRTGGAKRVREKRPGRASAARRSRCGPWGCSSSPTGAPRRSRCAMHCAGQWSAPFSTGYVCSSRLSAAFELASTTRRKRVTIPAAHAHRAVRYACMSQCAALRGTSTAARDECAQATTGRAVALGAALQYCPKRTCPSTKLCTAGVARRASSAWPRALGLRRGRPLADGLHHQAGASPHYLPKAARFRSVRLWLRFITF